MPKTNRFDAPVTVGYQSQFVPEKLPQDLMVQMLAGKQQKADQRLTQSTQLGEWTQRSLGEHDTAYVKAYEQEVQQFADDAMNIDRTSPEFQRKYLALSRKLQQDPNLKAVASAVATNDEFNENIKRLTAAGDGARALELSHDYDKRLANYTREGGEGFRGESLGDSNIKKGQNEFAETAKYFEKMKASGSEVLKHLASGISYKKGFTGITDPTIQKQAIRQFDSYLESDIGQQMRLRFLMQDHGMSETELRNTTGEERQRIETEIKQAQGERFTDIGRTFVHGRSTTSEDQARNAGRLEDMEKDVGVVVPTSQTPRELISKVDGDKQIENLEKQESAIWLKLWKDKKRIENGLPSLYTERHKIEMRAEANLFKSQKGDVMTAMNEVYMGVRDAQEKKANPVLNDIFAQQNKLAAKLKGIVSDADYKAMLNGISPYDSYWNDEGYTQRPSMLATAYKYMSVQTPEVKAIMDQMKSLETRKVNQRTGVEEKIISVYGKERAFAQHTFAVQSSGATVRTDDTSVMAAFNRQVTHNSEAYTLRDSDGHLMRIADYGPDARIESFDGSAVTSTGLDASKGTKVAVDGMVTIVVHKTDSSNKKMFSGDDGTTPMYTKIKVSANAEPVGNNSQFYRNEWAREQSEVADLKRRLGKTEQADLAYTHALQLNNNSVQAELDNFAASDMTFLPIAVGAYGTDGAYLGKTSVTLEKIGDISDGGGYELKIDGKEFQFQSMNEVNDAIQNSTNTIQN